MVTGPVPLLRNSWRQLTSMRTALVLLFLLAMAAIPGSLVPQQSIATEKVAQFRVDHPDLAPWYDRFGLFEVYASPWFAAIYLLLFASLVGCLLPRLRSHVTALLRVPPDAPSRLERMPAHAGGLVLDGAATATADRLHGLLKSRRFRTVTRPVDGGGFTVSAEKGYLKETGNLLFHFALLSLLIGVALGSWYGWHGNRLLVTGPDKAFCSTTVQFDEYGLGARVSDEDLPRFCVELTGFEAEFLDNGQPTAFTATVKARQDGRERTETVQVNHPLRLDGASLYLLGHGYAPIVRYTDRYGKSQTTVTPFLPQDGMLTSTGVALFPDTNVNPQSGKRDDGAQTGFSGVYLPTVPEDVAAGRSAFPAERDPRLMLQPYQGDLGVDAGAPLSVYSLDQRQINAGRLVKTGDPLMLKVNEKAALPDGSTVEFLGTRPFAIVSVRYDPGERVMLVGAVFLVLGLLASLTGKRRRVWFRVSPDGAVEAGGLPRSDYPGFRAEFDEIVRAAGAETEGGARVPVPAGREER